MTSKLFVALALGWSGCTGLSIDLNPADSPEGDFASPFDIAWTYNARAGFGPDAALVFDGYVLVGTRQGEVHVIDLQTGKRAGVRRFGDAVNGRPAVLNNTLIVPLAWGRNALAALDLRSSKLLWRVRGTPIQTGLVTDGEDVIAANVDGSIQRYRGSDGHILWEFTLPDDRAVFARPLIHAERLLVADDSGYITALLPEDGNELWQTRLSGPVYATPTAQNGIAYVPTTRGRLFALDTFTGAVQWEVALSDTTVRFAPPAADESLVIAGASDGFIRAWNAATGSLIWSFEATDAIVAKPLLTSGLAYIGSMGGLLYAVRQEDGGLVQEIELRGRVKSAIALESDGIIVLTEPRYVVKLGPRNGDTSTP